MLTLISVGHVQSAYVVYTLGSGDKLQSKIAFINIIQKIVSEKKPQKNAKTHRNRNVAYCLADSFPSKHLNKKM